MDTTIAPEDACQNGIFILDRELEHYSPSVGQALIRPKIPADFLGAIRTSNNQYVHESARDL